MPTLNPPHLHPKGTAETTDDVGAHEKGMREIGVAEDAIETDEIVTGHHHHEMMSIEPLHGLEAITIDLHLSAEMIG